MIFTTTNTIKGRKATTYHQVVTGEAVMGAKVFKDIFAGVRDIAGRRSSIYEKELQKSLALVLGDMEHGARQLGANAILDVDIDYENINNSMLMVSTGGTAVTIE